MGRISDSAAEPLDELLSKVPRITLAFWIVKICATTLGETGGDSLSMTLNLGYLTSTWIFLGFFIATLATQLGTKRYHPAAYWAVVVATTTVGTTTSDYLDRTAGLGYPKASLLLFCGVLVVLLAWRLTTGNIRADHVTNRADESFYWVTILVSNTLGTALGDFVADSAGIGFERGALVFAGLIAIVAAVAYYRIISRTVAFWAAYVLTRPLGATLGDTLTKPVEKGGLNLGRIASSLVIAVIMIAIVAITHRRKGAHAA
jgi:uncharacterized membrane-anchored protein